MFWFSDQHSRRSGLPRTSYQGWQAHEDESKIKAIKEWDPPTKVPQLRSFLGLVNYYRQFIKGYSARTAPLSDLLKKSKAWTWDEK